MKKKIGSLIFLAILIVSVSILYFLANKTFLMLDDKTLTISDLNKFFNNFQTQISLVSIICFIVLLIVGLVYYYFQKRTGYVLIANLFYIFSTLFNHISLTHIYLKKLSIDINESPQFLLNTFIAVFFILGGILISVIGFYALRNLDKRKGKYK